VPLAAGLKQYGRRKWIIAAALKLRGKQMSWKSWPEESAIA
jgi:hypothetical protein